MTGAQLIAYVKRRLGISNLAAIEQGGPFGDTAIEDALSEGRDALLQLFADLAPLVVQALVTLEAQADGRTYLLPAATKDPYRVLGVRAKTTLELLEPANELDQDNGEYEWRDTRTLYLAEHVNPPGGLEAFLVVHRAEIDSTTAEADIGLPTTCHRALGKYAAWLILTADEKSDATQAERALAKELARLESIYSDYDADAGLALREALLKTEGEVHSDMLY